MNKRLISLPLAKTVVLAAMMIGFGALPAASQKKAKAPLKPMLEEVIMDYSHCGYHQSDVNLPVVKGVVKIVAQSNLMTLDYPGSMPAATDRSADIQRAIDYVSSLPADANGHRGAVVLAKGEYLLENPLRISVSGVVVRGEKKEEVRLIKRGYDRGAIVYLEGSAAEQLAESGIEQLTLVSEYDARYPMDEDHAWTGIYVDKARDCWVRDVDFYHLAGSAVVLHRDVQQTTVENCRYYEPISENGGLRRRAFLTFGHKTLFLRCYSEDAIHAFSTGMLAEGPNAFVQCEGNRSLSYSGSTGAEATAILFDIVDIIGNDIVIGRLGSHKQQAGWNATASTLWQCSAAVTHVESPDPARHDSIRNADARSWLPAPADCRPNKAFGCHGQFWGNGYCRSQQDHISPWSLFVTQLKARGIERDLYILPRDLNTSTSPTIERAQEFVALTRGPRLTLEHWIDSVSLWTTIADDASLKEMAPAEETVAQEKVAKNSAAKKTDIYKLSGGRQVVPWWNGNLGEKSVSKAKAHVTRFVPDMEGNGFTDRIDSVIAGMKRRGNIILEHNYGLWYDRRRDDHARVMRRDGDVWAPFYDQPFARTGEGRAWDGLSLYDLTKPNQWYWSRLQEFATKAEPEGIMLFHSHYFQHNIIEAGAHWVDSPWRSANNVNKTGFNEPVNFSGDKRIFTAEQFYDVTHPVRRQLHRQYIRECLDRFATNGNVVHFISAEYTGPQHFMEFWLDVIDEWQKETGNDAVIALSCTKDVQDAILADAKRAAVVDVIDIRYWHYRNDGTLYAPPGGKNMAPRQFMRQEKPGIMGEKGAYRAVKEYRKKYPNKKVMVSASNYPESTKAIRKAGGVWYK